MGNINLENLKETMGKLTESMPFISSITQNEAVKNELSKNKEFEKLMAELGDANKELGSINFKEIMDGLKII